MKGEGRIFLSRFKFPGEPFNESLVCGGGGRKLLPACNVLLLSSGVERVGKQASLPRSLFCCFSCLSWLNLPRMSTAKRQSQFSSNLLRGLSEICAEISATHCQGLIICQRNRILNNCLLPFFCGPFTFAFFDTETKIKVKSGHRKRNQMTFVVAWNFL